MATSLSHWSIIRPSLNNFTTEPVCRLNDESTRVVELVSNGTLKYTPPLSMPVLWCFGRHFGHRHRANDIPEPSIYKWFDMTRIIKDRLSTRQRTTASDSLTLTIYLSIYLSITSSLFMFHDVRTTQREKRAFLIYSANAIFATPARTLDSFVRKVNPSSFTESSTLDVWQPWSCLHCGLPI